MTTQTGCVDNGNADQRHADWTSGEQCHVPKPSEPHASRGSAHRSAGESAAAGTPEAYYDLYQDPHEKNPHLVPLIHTQGQFNRMRARHELFEKKYPDVPNAHGIPYTGLSNARPETIAIGERVKRDIANMPFDIEEYLSHDIPGSDSVGDWGN